jgi:hypothetical protein
MHKEVHIYENFRNYGVLETVAVKFVLVITLPIEIEVISPTRDVCLRVWVMIGPLKTV